MPQKLPKRQGPIEPAQSPGLPKAEPNRVVIMRTMRDMDGREERVIDLIEIVKPGVLRTYRESRTYGPGELPKK